MESSNSNSPGNSPDSAAKTPPVSAGDYVPKRGLHEDWTASLIGLIVFGLALLFALGTRPANFDWSTSAPPPLSAEEKAAGKKPAAPWAAPLKGWIGKFSTWKSDPTAALRPKPKPKPKTETTQAEVIAADKAVDQPNGQSSQKASQLVENPGPVQWQGVAGAFLATLLVGLIACVVQLQTVSQLARFVPAFVAVFVLACLSFILAAQEVLEAANLEYALWALLVGLLVANTLGTPQWIKPAVRSELFIKVGLVLLGAEVLFSRLLELGARGIFVAWVVTPIVLISTYIFGQRWLKIESRSLNLVISADMSVCGVSAAIATAAACKAKKEELSLAIGLSLIFTVVMMIIQPKVIEAVGMPPEVGGAWLGGTIDSTGAVAAAANSSYLGAAGLETAVTVKMIQNILIGITAICVAVYWTRWVEPTMAHSPAQSTTHATPESRSQVGMSEIWRRFPKFVLGFLAASILASWLYANSYYSQQWLGAATDGVTKQLRTWLFCLAFVCIGLETNFRQLYPYLRSGKPLILYVCGQSLNLTLTLIVAFVMFEWLK